MLQQVAKASPRASASLAFVKEARYKKDMTPPTDVVQYKDLIALSTHIQNIIKGMTGMGDRVIALEAANIELHEILNGMKEAQQGSLTSLQELFGMIKNQQAQILTLNDSMKKQFDWQLANNERFNRLLDSEGKT